MVPRLPPAERHSQPPASTRISRMCVQENHGTTAGSFEISQDVKTDDVSGDDRSEVRNMGTAEPHRDAGQQSPAGGHGSGGSERTLWVTADGSRGLARTPQPREEGAVPSGNDQHSITELLNFCEPCHIRGSGDAEPEAPLHCRVVNVGEGNEMVIYGYCWSWWRAALSALLTLLSCGLILVAFYWRPQWHMRCFCSPCDLQDAEYVLMKTTDEFQEWHRQRVKFMYLKYSPQVDRRDPGAPEDVDEFSLLRKNISFTGIQVTPGIRYLQHQSIRYIWDPNKRSFFMLRGLEQNVSCSDLHKNYPDGLVYQESQNRKLIYGPNVIAVQVPPYWKLLAKEILNPFYAFQAFSVILWFVEAYYPYAVAIIVMSISSIALSLYTARKQYTMLHDMVQSHSSVRVSVLRKGSASEMVSSSELVPGDVIVIPEREMILPCDVVLMNGAVVVNESMLTGESVPVTKTPLPDICEAGNYNDPIFCLQDYKRHVLFCGTLIIQVRPYEQYVKAVVIRTGFLTTKGQLVRSILFPKPVDFKLFRDAKRFVVCLVLAAVLGFVYTVVVSCIRGEPIPEILLKAFDVITIVVPPALPAAVTVGVVYAQRRLRRRGIYCISPHRINLCGQLDLVCFDKTGTLTENGMDLYRVVPAKNKNFLYSDSTLRINVFTEDEVLAAMATCHSLTLTSSHSTLQGEPLDLTLFRATNWIQKGERGVGDGPEGRVTVGDEVDEVVELCTGSSICSLCVGGAGTSCPLQAANRVAPLATGATSDVCLPQVLEEMVSQARWLNRMNPLIVVKPTRPLNARPSPSGEVVSEVCRFRSGIGILRQFPFSSALQRMTVVGKNLDEQNLVAYCKGAPETVAKLCSPDSVPDDFQAVMESFTQRGYRVIGLAFREFKGSLKESDVKNVNREFVEQNMTFTGLVILENRLKKVTSSVFRELLKAGIRLVMITGDSTLTAIQVAKESGMIGMTEKVVRVKAKSPTATSKASVSWRSVKEPQARELKASEQEAPLSGDKQEEAKPRIHFVIDGPSLAVIEDKFPELLPKVTLYGTVFARMSPDMKTKLIKCLQSLEYIVGMCGDGANDCGALKTAHVGISLSQLEASVASPFTSKLPTIECVPILIKEGRAALVTSFCAFKYMALYSMIQYVSVLILYYISSNLGNWEFLYEDLFITSAIAITMSRNKAYEHLVPQRPNANLVSPQLLISVLMHIGLCSTFQLMGFLLVQIQPWYNSWDQGAQACASNDTFYGVPTSQQRNSSGVFNMQWKISNYINTTVFFVSVFQYITIAFVFSLGKPFRKPISTNYLFLAVLGTLYLFTLFLMLFPSSSLDTFFEFVCVPYIWRIYILLMVIAHFVLSVFLEEMVTNNPRLWNWLSRVYCPSASLVRHKRLHQELQNDPSWPPVTMSESHRDTVQQ
ncbi:polyamine-transporting ATPase 13A3-like [Pristis pectinata]|uniref:polyamine-transporting ATPase 13A3-like n=1 Tax=Pristis pectinata TaxID=685728 RepID=UPI00223D867C|nr:polyamine-transporting ATPase 13A3-like [Pristis pectinata]